jgi:hypothetical protein
MTLTSALAVVGAVVLFGLAVHWAWQERRARPRRADANADARVEPTLESAAMPAGMTSSQPSLQGEPWLNDSASKAANSLGPMDPMVGGLSPTSLASSADARGATRLDPTMDSALESRIKPSGFVAANPVDRIPNADLASSIPSLERTAVGAMPRAGSDVPRHETMAMPSLLRRAARLDAGIDAIAPIVLEGQRVVSGDMAQVHMPTGRRAGSKPFQIEGMNAETQAWELPVAGTTYSAFQAGVQMANRNGALNEIEYSEFVQKVQGFADAIGARLDAPDMLTVVAKARELDAFAHANDAVLSAELRSKGPAWSVGFVQQCATRLGFVAGGMPGRMVLPSEHHERGDPPVLTLTFDAKAALSEDPTRAVVRDARLTLDVPQTPPAAEPFAAWHRAATDLARDMSAELVDDQGAPIHLHAFAAIEQQLKQLYEQMAMTQLQAGSAAARRLFS